MSAPRRPTVAFLVVLGVLGGGLVFGSVSASAAFVHHLLAPEAGFGSFGRATGVAVDQASGNVLVVDSGSEANLVRVFGPEGQSPVGGVPAELTGLHAAFEFNQEESGIAVDNACYLSGKSVVECASFDSSDGDIYVPNVRGDGEVLEKFRLNAKDEYEYVCQLEGYGGLVGSACEKEPARSPARRFEHPRAAAVNAAGDVYVADEGGEAIYEFNAAGEEVEGPLTGSFGKPGYLALDGEGDLFVINSERDLFELKHQASGGFEPAVEIAGEAYAIAVDSVHELLYVVAAPGFVPRVEEYAIEGGKTALVSEFGEGIVGFSEGVGVDDGSGDIYVSELFGAVHIFGPALVAPDTKTRGVSGLHSAEATLEGEVDPASAVLPVTTCEFQYGPGEVESGTEPIYTASVPCASFPGAGEGFVAVSAHATGLTEPPYSPYHYRLVTGNENGRTYGEDETFLSAKAAPLVDDEPASASEVSQLSVTLNGTIDPVGVPTSYHFVYGTTSAYGSVAPFPERYVASDRADHTVTQTLDGLTPGTTYHFAVVANSPGGTSTGPDETFTTPPVPTPEVTTGGASGVSVGAATLSGSVNPQGWETSYYFEYGPSTAYGSRWPGAGVALGAFEGAQPVVSYVQNLLPGTLYHYRLVAANSGGVSYGPDQTFTTPEYPASVVQEAPLLRAPIGINPETPKSTTTKSTRKGKHKARTKSKRKKSKRRAGARGGKDVGKRG
jgi:hypothetical protein